MLKKFLLSNLIVLLLVPSLGYAQPYKGFDEEEIIRRARATAEKSNPAMDSRRMKVETAYLDVENIWIVYFYDPENPYVEFMLRVENGSGKDAELLRGNQIERYAGYFNRFGGRQDIDETEPPEEASNSAEGENDER